MRRFLSHLLSLDYRVRDACPDKLRKDDWYHFTNLAVIAHNVHYSHHHRSVDDMILLDWNDRCCLHPEVDKFINAPASMLGIETSKSIYVLVC